MVTLHLAFLLYATQQRTEPDPPQEGRPQALQPLLVARNTWAEQWGPVCALGPSAEAAALSETSLGEAGALLGHPPLFSIWGLPRRGHNKEDS